MERAINRNKASLEAHPEYYMRLLPSTEEQRALTDKWILPYRESIVQDSTRLREQVDRDILKDVEERARRRYWDKKYPIGMCREIRDGVLEKIKTDMHDRNMHGLQALKNFVREGGVIQPFWGIDKDKYFQNAIQIGNSILDVANDTVDRAKEPIVFYPDMRDAPIKPIDTFTQFADVASEYWGFDIYPNIYFPRFAPILPILSIHPERKTAKENLPRVLAIEESASDLVLKNLSSIRDKRAWGLSEDFLFSSPYSEKRLPPDVLESLMKGTPAMAKLQHRRPDFFRVTTDPEEARREIATFSFTGIEPEEIGKTVVKFANDAQRIFNDAELLNTNVLGRIKL